MSPHGLNAYTGGPDCQVDRLVMMILGGRWNDAPLFTILSDTITFLRVFHIQGTESAGYKGKQETR